MNQPDRLERDLTNWLNVSAAPRTPIYVNDLLALTARTRQRPAWLLFERWLPMGTLTLPRRALTPLPWRSIGLLLLLGLLMVAAAAIYVGATMRAVPTPYGVAGNGLVAVQDGGDILLVDPVSGERTLAIGGPSLDTEPYFSRDGTQLAFMRQTDVGRDLWIADADGTNQRLIAAGLGADASGGQWAPDGRSILLPEIVDGTNSITIVPTDPTGEARTLDVGMPAEVPTWGVGTAWRPPDGREILFRGSTPTGFGLFAVRPDGSGLRPVTASNGVNDYDALFYGWSPDGSQVAYQWRDVPRVSKRSQMRRP
jgi:WD40 repeat protein